MALRVLLADESTTIKRVMQLALQDFAVEVKAVPVGIDVLPVTKAFRPDIIFADVLLPKKSGYEVGKDLKKDPETKNIPLVLMWSGFMELDEAKAKESMAERRLEKPFEPETLRSLVTDLVKKTQTNPVSSYLKFPEMPEIVENKNETPQPETPKFAPNEPLNIELPADDDEFSQVPLHTPQIPDINASASNQFDPSEDWAHQDLSKFKIELPADGDIENPPQFSIDPIENKKLNVNHAEFEEVTFAKAPTEGPSTSGRDLSFDQEAIFREEARKVIEGIAWKILPEITERIVREEINKLLQDTEKSISVP